MQLNDSSQQVWKDSCLLIQMFPDKDFPGYRYRKSQDTSFNCTGDLVCPWGSHTTCTINFKNKTFSVTPIYTSEEINKPWRITLYSCSESPLSVTHLIERLVNVVCKWHFHRFKSHYSHLFYLGGLLNSTSLTTSFWGTVFLRAHCLWELKVSSIGSITEHILGQNVKERLHLL